MANLENNNFSINNLITMLGSKAMGDTQEKGKEAVINSAKKVTPLPILRQGAAEGYYVHPDIDGVFYKPALFSNSNTLFGNYNCYDRISIDHSVNAGVLKISVKNKDDEVDVRVWIKLEIVEIDYTDIKSVNEEVVVFCPANTTSYVNLLLSDYISAELYSVGKTIYGLYYTKTEGE